MEWNKNEIAEGLNDKCVENFGCSIKEVTDKQIYEAVCLLAREILMKKRREFQIEYEKRNSKQLYYMSLEFLVGTSLRNNLYNLGLDKSFEQVLRGVGIKLQDLYDIEPDAGLGNGGLGRLASCYMDAMTSCSMPATGFSIR
ncbi:MAG: glycogen/starch/alpha-glucan phosphorylase, partial [Oscillospiraceae bacterium]